MDRNETVKLREFLVGKPGVLTIAEIGINHDGSQEKALRLIEMVARSGADCVKFQTFRASDFLGDEELTYEYFDGQQTVTESQQLLFERSELPIEFVPELFNYAHKLGLVPLSTPLSFEAADLLDSLGARVFKIGSDDLVYHQLLKKVASYEKPVVLSTGMASLDEVRLAVEVLEEGGCPKVCLLHCVSLYPTPDDLVRLGAVHLLSEEFPHLEIGLSDHSSGIVCAVLSTCFGASIVEKHVTLDRHSIGPDHHFSSDERELSDLVTSLDRAWKMVGSTSLISEAELAMKEVARRSIFISTDLRAGQVVSAEHLAFLRPGTGMPPSESANVVGRKLMKDVSAGTLLDPSFLEGCL